MSITYACVSITYSLAPAHGQWLPGQRRHHVPEDCGRLCQRHGVRDMCLTEMRKIWRGRFFSTFGGNPVACAAALATLRVIHDERLQDNAVGIYCFAFVG